MNHQELEEILQVRSENEHLEFKTAENRYDFEELVEYCVALANEGGGQIFLGISNNIPRQIVGTKAFDTPERTVSGIYSRLNIKVTFEEITHPAGRVLLFNIPSRPIGMPIQYKGRYLMRVGEELVPMSPDRLRTILAEGQPDWLIMPAKENCDADTIVQSLDTQSYFDLSRIPYPTNRESVLEKFESEKIIIKNNNYWNITNLGALLFAKSLFHNCYFISFPNAMKAQARVTKPSYRFTDFSNRVIARR